MVPRSIAMPLPVDAAVQDWPGPPVAVTVPFGVRAETVMAPPPGARAVLPNATWWASWAMFTASGTSSSQACTFTPV